jgi:uncharacterized protein YjdB
VYRFDTEYATVDGYGRVTGLRAGTAIISAQLRNGLEDAVTLQVVPNPFNEASAKRR